MSTLLRYAKERLAAFRAELKRLEAIDFPYPDSEQALREIDRTFRHHLEKLELLSPNSDPDTVHAACTSALSALTLYLPHVGFIVRSTDIRNSFEICGPLRRLCCDYLGQGTKLILSSEWEYSPYTYVGVPVLNDFVMIGLPASESANPLLVPLAGHELGHSIWRDLRLHEDFSPKLEQAIVSNIRDSRWHDYQQRFPGISKDDLTSSLDAKQTWEKAHEWALSQCEETFCDFFGLRIFEEAYLHSFAYLLAPNLGGYRSFKYPAMLTRVSNLRRSAERFKVDMPASYEGLFKDQTASLDDPSETLLARLADASLEHVVEDLIAAVLDALVDTQTAADDPDVVESILRGFVEHVVPAKGPATLSEILNAAWKASLTEDLWADRPWIPRDEVLRELVLKSIEVLEISQIVGQE